MRAGILLFRWRCAKLLAVVLCCGVVLPVRGSEPGFVPSPEWPGGEATVTDDSKLAFSQPVSGLSDAQRSTFSVGNSFFNQNWVIAPASTAGRDGLGPLFNARSCSACHLRDGRSQPPEDGGVFSVMLMRLSVPGTNAHGGSKPDPIYGGQIQGHANPGVPAEADVLVSYKAIAGRYADGEPYELRRPVYSVRNPGYGALSVDARLSPRVAPAMIGLGLLEAVPEAQLAALSDPGDRNLDGISGRFNRVWNIATQRHETGRFGWKAEEPTVMQQVAGAFNGDMGLTTRLFPRENHTSAQTVAASQPSGGTPEVSDHILDAITFYARTLAVPARRHFNDSEVRRGERLFDAAGCARCHIPRLETGEVPELPVLSRQAIHPYTDLLLHDMGEELSDQRPVFEADGREWRTPPLWGAGLVKQVNGHTRFLHDGRARSLAEAILWHGGEGEAAREAFKKLSAADRAALLKFVESL